MGSTLPRPVVGLPVPGHTPSVQVWEPQGGFRYAGRSACRDAGVAYDVEDGVLPDAALAWDFNRDGNLGTGESPRADAFAGGSRFDALRPGHGGQRLGTIHTDQRPGGGDKPDLQVVSPRTTTGEVYANQPARVAVSVLLAGESQEIKVTLLDKQTNQPLGSKTFSVFGNQVQDILFDILYPTAGTVSLSAAAELVDTSVQSGFDEQPGQFELERSTARPRPSRIGHFLRERAAGTRALF